MASVCAWCNNILDKKDDLHYQSITQGICSRCHDGMIFQLKVEAQEYIDTLKEPVFIIDLDHKVITANNAAQSCLNKDLGHIQDEPKGNVLGCPNALEHSGCGNSPECSVCTINRTIMDTQIMGKSTYRAPAILKQKKNGEIITNPQRISTERLGDVVYLRFDK